MLDWLPIAILGFLGSFGHCVGMCGPLSVAFSLSRKYERDSDWRGSLSFHFLLNSGRILSYSLVGAALGGVGSVLIASGQLAGIGSEVRQGIAIVTGLMLIWLGLRQILPDSLPRLPVLHPIQGEWHRRLNEAMNRISLDTRWWMPLILGSLWGLIPCGFLYTAQIKAAETGNLFLGASTMLAFGLGTMPTMLGVGISASRLSATRRSQLFRLGGWITLSIGILTLWRSDAMVDFTGHASLLLLILALIARPIDSFWAAPLQYRRAIGVGSFVLAVAHTSFMLDHSFNWNLKGLSFMLPMHQLGIITGTIALLLMAPAAFTSSDFWQETLGKNWRRIHLLCVPALALAALHALSIGSHYLGKLEWHPHDLLRSLSLGAIALLVLVVRLKPIAKNARLR